MSDRSDTSETKDGKYVLEEVTIEDDDDDMEYEEVDIESQSDSEDDDNDDFEQVLKDLKKEQSSELSSRESDSEKRRSTPRGASTSNGRKSKAHGAKSGQNPAVVDDFIRNFLTRNNMKRTLEAFESEWYELQSSGEKGSMTSAEVPDVYAQNEILQERIKELEICLEKTGEAKNKAQGTWDRFRKERDVHKMHHRRLVQEKDKLLKDLKRIQKQVGTYEPIIRELKKKYNKIHSDRALIMMERDKLEAKNQALEEQLANSPAPTGPRPMNFRSPRSPPSSHSSRSGTNSPARAKTASNKMDSALPSVNPPKTNIVYDPTEVENFRLSKTFKGHSLPISSVAIHPRKPIIATGSDDKSFKLWSIPTGELILSGEGHTDWISACEFRPDGSMLGTTSGDGTLKIWDLRNACCAMTFKEHTQAVWDLSFHRDGDFVVTASVDRTAKLWDLNSERCRQTFRDNLDTVNSICFQPYSHTICTGGGDRTISLFDMRSGLCIHTIYGHENSINHVSFNASGESIISCDANGVANVWDIRMLERTAEIVSESRLGLNIAMFDRSGERIITGGDSGLIRTYNIHGEPLRDLEGHDDAVQDIALDPQGRFMISASSDCTFRMWTP